MWIVVALLVVAGVAGIAYSVRANHPMRHFRRTLKQIKALPEHHRKERV